MRLTEGDHISLLSRLSLISSLDKRRLVIHSETRIFQVSSQKRRVMQRVEGGASVPMVECLEEGEADISLPAGCV